MLIWLVLYECIVGFHLFVCNLIVINIASYQENGSVQITRCAHHPHEEMGNEGNNESTWSDFGKITILFITFLTSLRDHCNAYIKMCNMMITKLKCGVCMWCAHMCCVIVQTTHRFPNIQFGHIEFSNRCGCITKSKIQFMCSLKSLWWITWRSLYRMC